MNTAIEFNAGLIKRYDVAGPRYTSYPTAVQFNERFSSIDYRQAAEWTNEQHRRHPDGRPLSLYFHIPFCNTVCFFCGCSKVVTKFRDRAAPYLQRLHKEIEMQSLLFDNDRMVDQLHWGGGTPTFISHQEMIDLMEHTRRHFRLHEDDRGEYSIEIDPREISPETLAVLRELGFNRISLGVQDFDPKVQQAVNRIQPESLTISTIEEARQLGYKSISVDLIYGLPFQSVQSFSRTLDRIIDISPDRLSVFNYAHLPEMFKPQRRINAADLPEPEEKLQILKTAIDKLTSAGYVYIGMDHFARPEDELTLAQQSGKLYRNFQGYSTHADCDLVAMGLTSIGKVGHSFSQNVKNLDDYYKEIDDGNLPIFRGLTLDSDDLIRQQLIFDLICHFRLDFDGLEMRFNIQFEQYFARELAQLATMEADGLMSIENRQILVKPLGRLLIRNICMVFDRYLQRGSEQRYSKAI